MTHRFMKHWLIGLVGVAILLALIGLTGPGRGDLVFNAVGLLAFVDLVVSAVSASQGRVERNRNFYLRRACVGALAALFLLGIGPFAGEAVGPAVLARTSLAVAANLVMGAVSALIAAKIIAVIYPYNRALAHEDA